MATERLAGYEMIMGRWDEARHRAAPAGPDKRYFIAERGAEPVGFAILAGWASPDRVTLLKRTAVAMPGKGYSKFLFQKIITAVFTQTDAYRLWLDVFPKNARACRAYEAAGFVAEGSFFIGETWAKTNMTRLHGRCQLGQRLIAKDPHGHWKTLTLVAGLRCDGIVAQCVFNSPINARSFLAWVIQFLVPILQRGNIVVMDNLSRHKSSAVRRAIREAEAKLFFLPPYSPDLNPTEQAFAKLKKLLRKENARTVEQTTNCIGKLIDQINPTECANYFREAGYAT